MALAEFTAARWRRISHPGWQRELPHTRQRQIDVFLVAGYLLCAVFSTLLLNSVGAAYGQPTMPWPQQAGWILGLGVPLIWRRRWPSAVVFVVSAVFLSSQLLGFVDNLMASVSLFWALYSVGAWSRNRRAAFFVRAGIVTAMLVSLVINLVRYHEQLPGGDAGPFGLAPFDPGVAGMIYGVLLNVGFFFAATFFGTAAWTSAKRHHDLIVQAAELAAAQESVAQRAVMRERVHIARELHDVVAHHVSVMGVQASAARRVLVKSPALAVDALTAELAAHPENTEAALKAAEDAAEATSLIIEAHQNSVGPET